PGRPEGTGVGLPVRLRPVGNPGRRTGRRPVEHHLLTVTHTQQPKALARPGTPGTSQGLSRLQEPGRDSPRHHTASTGSDGAADGPQPRTPTWRTGPTRSRWPPERDVHAQQPRVPEATLDALGEEQGESGEDWPATAATRQPVQQRDR